MKILLFFFLFFIFLRLWTINHAALKFSIIVLQISLGGGTIGRVVLSFICINFTPFLFVLLAQILILVHPFHS